MKHRKGKVARPSLRGLRLSRARLESALTSLREAFARPIDIGTKAKVARLAREAERRLENLNNGLSRLRTLTRRRDEQLAKVQDLNQKIGRLLGKQHRSTERWLSRWERL